MPYLALYRKYRPLTFDKLIGQEMVTKTLVNQIKKNQIGHAYLFTGTRGTGKTSAAKLFARAINCLTPIEGSPCLKCSVCKANEGNNIDILEIDAASNNRVDEARELRDKVQYPPVNGMYKVFIIDEVHMLSDGAFNALLKTLEEPPLNVVFILCTTEPQKLPSTILSRCMRFDFGFVALDKIEKLLKDVFIDVGKKVSPEAIKSIAIAGEGSVRDALSIADRCLAFADGELTYDDVIKVLGQTDKTKLRELYNAILQSNLKDILTKIDELVSAGKSISVLSKNLALSFRDILIAKTCKNYRELLVYPKDFLDKIYQDSEETSIEKLVYAINIFTELENQIKQSLSPRILLEVAAIKAATNSGAVSTDLLDIRLTKLEKSGVSIQPKIIKEQKPKNIERDYLESKTIWSSVLKGLRAEKSAILNTACAEVVDMYIAGDEFVLQCNLNEYNLLKDVDNFNLIEKLIYEQKPLNFILKLNTTETVNIDEDIRDIAKLVGDELKIEN